MCSLSAGAGKPTHASEPRTLSTAPSVVDSTGEPEEKSNDELVTVIRSFPVTACRNV